MDGISGSKTDSKLRGSKRLRSRKSPITLFAPAAGPSIRAD